jgi:hypothetical protein
MLICYTPRTLVVGPRGHHDCPVALTCSKISSGLFLTYPVTEIVVLPAIVYILVYILCMLLELIHVFCHMPFFNTGSVI